MKLNNLSTRKICKKNTTIDSRNNRAEQVLLVVKNHVIFRQKLAVWRVT